jgi:hypothetical protein
MAVVHMNEVGDGTPSLPLFSLVFACAKNKCGKRQPKKIFSRESF